MDDELRTSFLFLNDWSDELQRQILASIRFGMVEPGMALKLAMTTALLSAVDAVHGDMGPYLRRVAETTRRSAVASGDIEGVEETLVILREAIDKNPFKEAAQ